MPSIADLIERHREQLTQRFLAEASRLESARGLKPHEVIDTLPEYLTTLASVSRQGHRGDAASTKQRLEDTHIGARLRLGYNQDEVTSEYVLMGRLIAELWEALPPREQPTPEDSQLLFTELDSAMDYTVAVFTGYSLEDRQREKRTLRHLETLAPKALGRDEALDVHLAPLLEVIQHAMEADGAELFVLEGREVLRRAAASGRCVVEAEAARVPVAGDSFLARLARSEEPLILAGLPEASAAWREGLCGTGLSTLMGLRLWPHGELMGVLYVGLARARPFQPQAKRYLETLVEYLSGILDRAFLFGQLRDAHARLGASEERYRLASTAITDAIWDWDLATNALAWNEGLETLVGYPPSEAGADAHWWAEHIHPEDREAVLRDIHAAIDGGRERWRAEYRFRHRDGHYVHVTDHGVIARDARGRGVRMVGAMQDITARTHADAARRESEDRLRLALTAGRLGTWDFDPVTGVLRWDTRTRALFGLPPEAEVSWDTFIAGVHPEDRERTALVVQRTLAGEDGGAFNLDYRTVGLADGVERWVSAHGQAFFDVHRRAVRFIGTVLDITERKRLDEQLLRREEELQRRADLEEKLIGIVSHDLRNPLNAVGYSTTLLLRRADLDDGARRVIERIRSATERANRMIRDLLDFTQARLGGAIPVHREPADLNELVRAVVEEVRLASPGRRIEVTTQGGGEGTWDTDRLAQVLTNLLNNALRYGAEDAPVRVETRAEDGVVELRVHNAGEPIRPEALPILFQPMKRGAGETEATSPGLGLGLYIVDRIVHAHGGSVSVSSTAEEGTTFCVRLPR
ncbi:sensor histidine kinase [Pyxidicoccus xibeiensis]|uniref:sensor histidine kinase n=1 Tax=Pyxidicoccus xibeiensis TaxID=2906759 RepID=UPI0020A757EB|nr:PAS domain-containing protein [Pyxidicoccus xibeiensis]MCP3139612.1 PAS domain-containing protein [Pyxidicoccus xibeiensis]